MLTQNSWRSEMVFSYVNIFHGQFLRKSVPNFLKISHVQIFKNTVFRFLRAFVEKVIVFNQRMDAYVVPVFTPKDFADLPSSLFFRSRFQNRCVIFRIEILGLWILHHWKRIYLILFFQPCSCFSYMNNCEEVMGLFCGCIYFRNLRRKRDM